MNKYAYCINAHSNPQTLATLISQIDSPYNDIYLHIDKKQISTDCSNELTLKKVSWRF